MKNSKFITIFGRCNPKLGSKTYGVLPRRGMGYGLLQIYGLQGTYNSLPTEVVDPKMYGISEVIGYGKHGL